ncbi:MAG TPA: type ISP restriction/modification enzyme, partial [Anaerolineales bacterium]
TGVCITFMVKTEKKGKTPAQIFYTRRDEYELATEKLDFLRSTKFSEIKFENVRPDVKNNWLNITDNDWDNLIPLISKETKNGVGQKVVFSNFSRGAETTRDEWVYDYRADLLEQKIQFFIDVYNQDVEKLKGLDENEIGGRLSKEIKWSSSLTPFLLRGQKLEFNGHKIYDGMYRPFIKTFLYFDDGLIHRRGQHPEFFPEPESKNLAICVTDAGSAKPFMALVTDKLPDLHLVGAGASTQCLPFYRYSESGNRTENLTDWALGQFEKHYGKGGSRSAPTITKEDIFHYVYAVLHHPAYRLKYEINLKREFPRIPFYDDTSTSHSASFWKWADWGKRLMELHLNYETIEPYPLERGEREGKVATPDGMKMQPTCRLIAHKEQGIIEVDTATTLRGVPAEAWEYRLGTYSALEWILERYKEKKPKDPTIAEKFNTYKFADYKEQVIKLLMRVCSVSVETMKIIKEMPE